MRASAAALLTLNALDLTSSLRPSHLDALRPAPAKPGWAWALQGALALAALAWASRRAPASWRRLRALPLPRPAAIVLGAFFLGAAAHVALRDERYPFSNVGMFSTAVPDGAGAARARVTEALLVAYPEGVGALSFLREGSPLFARHGFGWDYKAGWVMHLYGLTHSRALEVARLQLAAEGYRPPARTRVRYRVGTGVLLLRDEAP